MNKKLVSGLVVAVVGLALFAPAAEAQAPDPFKLAGLTGGDNAIAIAKLNTQGEISVNSKGTTTNTVIAHYVGPEADFLAQCRQSGYRVNKVVGADGLATTFGSKESRESGKVAAALQAIEQKKDEAKVEAALVKVLKDACATGQTSVRLPVSARLYCKRVKFGFGAENPSYMASPITATFKLTCQ